MFVICICQKIGSHVVFDMLKVKPCHAEKIKMSHPFLIVNQSDYLILVVDTNSHSV